mmetsp:Transcript_52692/g.133779  ORF Transcript_52692/g.133779 Transcript_52692/m.133779 type:complete len:190 (+) Transcript_52692:46-615(+)
MGQCCLAPSARLLRRLAYGRTHRIIMLGLDSAGLQTALHHLNLGQVVPSIVTIGWTVQSVDCRNLEFYGWSVSFQGPRMMRRCWRHYFQSAHGIIFVVDCNDRERLDDARDELMSVLAEDELRDVPLLVYANKQDLPNALNAADLTEQLRLWNTNDRQRQWYVQGTCALTGAGLHDGLAWLLKTMDARR